MLKCNLVLNMYLGQNLKVKHKCPFETIDRGPKLVYNSFNVYLGQFVKNESLLDWDETFNLGEFVYDNPNPIVATWHYGQSKQKVHCYVFPFPFRSWQRPRQSTSLLLRFCLFTNQTFGYKLGYLLPHTWTPVIGFQSSVHLSTFRMHHIRGTMSLI